MSAPAARAIVLAALALAPAVAAADPLAAVARVRIDATLPADLAVADVHLAARLAVLEVEPSSVAVIWPRPPRAGTASVRLMWTGGQSRLVPVTVAPRRAVAVAVRELAAGETITADDIRIEARALAAGLTPATQPIGQTATTAVAAGAVIVASAVTRPTPIARGTEVTVEVRRGAVKVTARGTLERAARPGEDAFVRLAPDRPPVRGTLVAADLVVIGEVTP